MNSDHTIYEGWKENTGLAEDTDKVAIYCEIPDKQEWTREANKGGYKSRSEYLYELVMEFPDQFSKFLFAAAVSCFGKETFLAGSAGFHGGISRLRTMSAAHWTSAPKS